jgi:S-adenosylmethionine:tRNA ribosyltransferase-isomerase
VDMNDFAYELPEARIAQRPATPRDSARLLVDASAGLEDAYVRDLPSLLGQGDLLVLNRTRVLPARLALKKPTGGLVEVLLLEPRSGGHWEALIKPSRKVPPGMPLRPAAADSAFSVVAGADLGSGKRLVELRFGAEPLSIDDLEAPLAEVGVMPLPPYITETLADPARYQTVYAEIPGSVAAPTAGLHFTPELLNTLREAGVVIAEVELHVGLDTFRPVTADNADDHVMHSERFVVSDKVRAACERADRVIAVGTTSVRALESDAVGHTERTDLFIRRGFDFKVVDLLLTNFHMSRSTLLMMVDAFVGERWRTIYETALDRDYRFLSFGDAMLLSRSAELNEG